MGVETGPWTGRDKFRLRQLVTRACVLGLRMRLYTLDELPDRAVILNTRDEEYNSGSGEECHYPGWRQSKGAGTDQYDDLAARVKTGGAAKTLDSSNSSVE